MNKRIFTLCLALVAVTASIQAEELWVAGVQVSLGSNKTGTITVTGSNIKSGTVKYNYDTKTLTLNGVTIERSGDNNRGLRSSVKGLTVNIIGVNYITTTNAAGMRFDADATITGEDYLYVKSDETGIYVDKGATLTINGKRNYKSSGLYIDVWGKSGKGICGDSYSNGGSVVVKGYARLSCGGPKHALSDLKSFTVYSPAGVGLDSYGVQSTVANVASITWGTGMMITKPANAVFDSSKRTIHESGSSSDYKSSICIYPVIPLNETNFPDANFRSWLKKQIYYNEGGYLECCDDKQNITIQLENISNMKGIENFSYLHKLDCMGNGLNALDVSKFTYLTELNCVLNNLEKLDVSKNTYLTSLSCYLNNIKGAKMDALIASLPTVESGTFCVFYDDKGERNICTTLQVAAAKKKGWKVTCYKNGVEKVYAGSASGDANGDERLNKSDIISIINYIIHKTTAGFKFKEADLNNDGKVDAADLVILINRLNGKW